MKINLARASKFLNFILQHNPEKIGLVLEKGGWASIDFIVEKTVLTREHIQKIVENDEKQCYSFNEDKTKIKANFDHSINIELDYIEKSPPNILYHGTDTKNISSIFINGILPIDKNFVHLSEDIKTATIMGKQHGIPAVFKILTEGMIQEGHKFYKISNGIWLTKKVASRFIAHQV